MRASAPRLYLDGGVLGEILLLRRYIPEDLKPKDKLDVFVYLDSEDRLVATTETSLATIGEFAYVKVISVNRSVGAFLDWGLARSARNRPTHTRFSHPCHQWPAAGLLLALVALAALSLCVIVAVFGKSP